MIPSHFTIYDTVRQKNYNILDDFLKRISYKPGWNIYLTEEQNEYAFIVNITYDSYESENAAFFPVAAEDKQVTAVRARLERANGKTVLHPEKRYFRKKFYMLDLDHMAPENVIKHVIGDSIKQAEMFELNRWFKVEGVRVFGEENE